MNDEEFGSIELLRRKYKKGDQIIQVVLVLRLTGQFFVFIKDILNVKNTNKSS